MKIGKKIEIFKVHMAPIVVKKMKVSTSRRWIEPLEPSGSVEEYPTKKSRDTAVGLTCRVLTKKTRQASQKIAT